MPGLCGRCWNKTPSRLSYFEQSTEKTLAFANYSAAHVLYKVNEPCGVNYKVLSASQCG